MILNINGKDFEIESITRPEVEFDQHEVLVHGQQGFVIGAHTWRPVTIVASTEVVDAMVNPDERGNSKLSFNQDHQKWTLEECYVLVDPDPYSGTFNVFYRHAHVDHNDG